MIMDKKSVIIITDCKDVAYNEMKWIIEKECYKLDCRNVEFELLPVEEFSIINAAFLTRLIADHCNPGTTLSVVINPLKNRYARIYGKLPNGVNYFGANTGALTWLLEDFAGEDIYEIYDPGFISFGGKYVHAPNVAKIVAGVSFTEMGKKFPRKSLTKLEIKAGTVVHIDNFGLIKIADAPISYKDGQKFQIFKNGEYVLDAIYMNRMMSLDDNIWALYPGSSLDSLPELGCVRNKDAYKDIKIKIGDIITWEKIS